MTTENKKTEEGIIIKLFREQCSEFPKGILIPAESPDFILSIGPRKKIGIELTRLHIADKGLDPFSYENLSACILSKEDKLRLYRKKKLQAYWLILSVQDPAYRPRYNLSNKLSVWKFPSGFDRVCLFDVYKGRVYEINA